MHPKKIAIIVRNDTLHNCTGHGCLNAFLQRLDAFTDYDQTVQLVSFTHECGDLDKKIITMKRNGIDTVHLSSCLRGKSDRYEELAERLARDFDVIGYTHGNVEGRTRRANNIKKIHE
jgi:predicted metal-binding protein